MTCKQDLLMWGPSDMLTQEASWENGRWETPC